jgi:hypothetical protein
MDASVSSPALRRVDLAQIQEEDEDAQRDKSAQRPLIGRGASPQAADPLESSRHSKYASGSLQVVGEAAAVGSRERRRRALPGCKRRRQIYKNAMRKLP